MKIWTEEQLFSHQTDWRNQNYHIKNKLLECRNGEVSLNVADVGCAEIVIAQHVQRTVFGKIYTKLSLYAEKYAKAVSQIQNTQLK